MIVSCCKLFKKKYAQNNTAFGVSSAILFHSNILCHTRNVFFKMILCKSFFVCAYIIMPVTYDFKILSQVEWLSNADTLLICSG